MRIGARYRLALKLHDQAQHAMRRRVLRADIDRMTVVDVDHTALGLLCAVLHPAAHASDPPRVAFSSPGSVVIASQGERKSKLRNSCVNATLS